VDFRCYGIVPCPPVSKQRRSVKKKTWSQAHPDFRFCRWNFSRDVYPSTWKEIIPELVYGSALFIIAILGVVSHFRFKRLIYQTRDSTNGKSISSKITYFKDLNFILTICLLLDGACFIILSVDGLTSKWNIQLHCSFLFPVGC
jgi:hypothetical protein